MESPNPELLKMITELKALPKKDRKAIERQLSGLDQIAVKKASKVKTIASAEHIIEEQEDLDEDEDTPVNIMHFSPWLNKRLSALLDTTDSNQKSSGIARAVVSALPDCIEQTNKSLEDFTSSDKMPQTSGFKSILSRLRGEEA